MEPDRQAVGSSTGAADTLSAREIEVLRAAAQGLDNAGIAKRLGISPRTIERHLSNAYAKLGVSGKAARAAAVAEVLRRGLV